MHQKRFDDTEEQCHDENVAVDETAMKPIRFAGLIESEEFAIAFDARRESARTLWHGSPCTGMVYPRSCIQMTFLWSAG